ncbi:MAG: hypothetical protein RML85_01870 [Acidobacteriota bacterium]|nr:hypothetical protein [Acidobacteriota bacterium]
MVDIRLGRVLKWRMQCGRCGRTWTCQPEGIKAHSQRSQRVRALNVLLYALGLSYRAVAAVLWSVGAPESPASVYRDVRAGGEAARRLHHRGKRRVRVAGIDGTGQRMAEPGNAHSENLTLVVEVGSRRVLEVQLLYEQDVEAVQHLVQELEAPVWD